jgi:putative FmdB family regulatory protein
VEGGAGLTRETALTTRRTSRRVPTYGYRCEECGQEFDVRQRMTDEAGAACPQCGGPGRRLFFPAGIVFKGTGFYKTDSRTGSDDGSSVTPVKESPAKETKNTTSSGSTSSSKTAD